MILDITTPALLFPAISLLFLAYTNRFVSTGTLIRGLAANIKNGKSTQIKGQIKNLKRRMELIRWMQIFGALSLLLCTISMGLLFFELEVSGKSIFVSSLLSMCISLILCLWEIYISTTALKLELRGVEYFSKSNEVEKNKKEGEE